MVQGLMEILLQTPYKPPNSNGTWDGPLKVLGGEPREANGFLPCVCVDGEVILMDTTPMQLFEDKERQQCLIKYVQKKMRALGVTPVRQNCVMSAEVEYGDEHDSVSLWSGPRQRLITLRGGKGSFN